MTKDAHNHINEADSDAALPFDFTKLLNHYKVPGVDFSAMLAREKKNIDALAKANTIAFRGWQALIQRQSEILRETMSETMATARKQGDARGRLELATQGFEKALDNMRELALMAAKSHKEAFGVVQERMTESINEFGKLPK